MSLDGRVNFLVKALNENDKSDFRLGFHITEWQWNGAGKLTITKDVPAQDIISWKNGFFYFGRASFEEVMRQLARWYDVDVKYQGTAPAIEFGGKIDRSLPLNDLLDFLDKNKVHFRLESRTHVVLPS